MKDLKHIRRFNEHRENLNIPDISESFEDINKISKDAKINSIIFNKTKDKVNFVNELIGDNSMDNINRPTSVFSIGYIVGYKKAIEDLKNSHND